MKNVLYLILIVLFFSSCERQSGRRSNLSQEEFPRKESHSRGNHQNGSSGKNIVQMRKEGGVYLVPIKINGTEMEFIFDTGASDITISLVEAMYLSKQGKLSDDDIIGQQQYQIADGSICVGMVINLRTVQIADKILYNVQASVVDNMSAPLLLGQSALSRFGNIEIDYNRLQIRLK